MIYPPPLIAVWRVIMLTLLLLIDQKFIKTGLAMELSRYTVKWQIDIILLVPAIGIEIGWVLRQSYTGMVAAHAVFE